jgi:hypothetical protein
MTVEEVASARRARHGEGAHDNVRFAPAPWWLHCNIAVQHAASGRISLCKALPPGAMDLYICHEG